MKMMSAPQLVGEDTYRNFSRCTAESIAPPRRGAHVRLGLDASGFIRELQVLDATPATSSTTSTTCDRSITRLAVLKAASNFVGLWGQNREDVRSDRGRTQVARGTATRLGRDRGRLYAPISTRLPAFGWRLAGQPGALSNRPGTHAAMEYRQIAVNEGAAV
jgi:hypothetical protein